MARSKKKTTVAVLRGILGEDGQRDYFAKLIGMSHSWVRHASCGVLPLTRKAAFKIASATGVSPEWLLADDVSQPPMTSDLSRPYDLNAYLEYKNNKRASVPNRTDPLAEAVTEEIPEGLLKILSAIHASGDVPWRLRAILQNLEEFADRLADDFKPDHQRSHTEDGNGSFNPREAAFIRSALHCTQAHLKKSKSSKASSSYPNGGGEPLRKIDIQS
jgi:hypothetical protein